MSDRPSRTRRRFLQTTGALSAGGLLTGCTSKLGGKKSEFTFSTGPSQSMAFALANQLATTLKQNSDLTMNVKASTSSQSVAMLGKGKTDLAYSTALVGQQAVNRKGPFSESQFSNSVMQVMSFYWIRTGLVAKTSSDIAYHEDLNGKTIAPGPSGASYFAPQKIGINTATENYEIRNSGISKLVNMLPSGKADAVGGPMYINGATPSFIQQIYSDNEVNLVGFKDEHKKAINQNNKISGTEVPNDQLGKNIEDFGEQDSTFMVSANYVMYGSEKMPKQTVYDMLNMIWKQKGSLPDKHAGFKPWTNGEFWTTNFSTEISVHPGAAKFLKEKGLWSDKYSVGSV